MGGITFLSPWWLVALPVAITGLVYIYKNRTAQRTRVVSTLLLLKDFVKPALERAKVELPLRFFLELITLCILMALLAGIQVKSQGRRIAIIIDDSLSTRAKSITGSPLADHIKEQAEEYIDSLSGGAEIDLYRTPGQRAVLEHADGSSVEDALESDGDSRHPDQLGGVVQSALRKGYDEIAVFTDKEIQGFTPISALQFHTVRGQLKDKGNISLEKLSLYATDRKIHGAIRSFSELPASVTISSPGGDRQILKIDPHASKEVVIPVPQKSEEMLPVKMVIQEGSLDALVEDNEGMIASNPKRSEVIDVFSEPANGSLNLSEIHSYHFSQRTPREYQTSSEGAVQIFHRFTPEALPDSSALFVLPGNSSLFASKGVFDGLTATRFDASNPLTTYLHVNLLTFPQGQIFTPLPWQQVVISTEAGPILLAGETNGHRYIVSGIELFPFRGKESPLVSILTLNMLKWLKDEQTTSDQGFFYSEEESNIQSNVIDVTVFEQPGKFETENPKDRLRDWLLLLILIVLVTDLAYTIKSKQIFGARR